jgi:hypothetical protein
MIPYSGRLMLFHPVLIGIPDNRVYFYVIAVNIGLHYACKYRDVYGNHHRVFTGFDDYLIDFLYVRRIVIGMQYFYAKEYNRKDISDLFAVFSFSRGYTDTYKGFGLRDAFLHVS